MCATFCILSVGYSEADDLTVIFSYTHAFSYAKNFILEAFDTWTKHVGFTFYITSYEDP